MITFSPGPLFAAAPVILRPVEEVDPCAGCRHLSTTGETCGDAPPWASARERNLAGITGVCAHRVAR